VKVSLKDDSLPEGTEFYVRGLGTLINGQSIEFTAAEAEIFESQTGLKLSAAFKEDPRITVGSGGKGGDD